MACKVGIDKQYRPQPAPARWGKTYRCERRNSIKSLWEWRLIGSRWIRVKIDDPKIWGEIYYSERHFVRYRKTAV